MSLRDEKEHQFKPQIPFELTIKFNHLSKIARVKELISNNQKQTIRTLHATTGLNIGTLHSILTENQGLRKLFSSPFH